jgi:hypothetical protein
MPLLRHPHPSREWSPLDTETSGLASLPQVRGKTLSIAIYATGRESIIPDFRTFDG